MKTPQESNTRRAAVARQPLVRLSDAMIAWNPAWGLCARGGEPGQVGVCKHPDGGQLKHLSMWMKFKSKDATTTEAMLKMMVEAWHLACRDGVPLANIHAALSAIPEYNDLLSEDFQILQPNAKSAGTAAHEGKTI